jgi:titin
MSGAGTENNKIIGNYIGTDVSGTADVGNTGYGVGIRWGASNNAIGGTKKNEGNVISANGSGGVSIGLGGSNGNKIQGNLIGTTAKGKDALGNGASGIIIFLEAVDNLVGGDEKHAGNVIAYNGGSGVLIDNNDLSLRNKVSRNSIFGNDLIGIDLSVNSSWPYTDGVTPNDPGDVDTGPNNLQNFPVLASAVISKGKTKVTGTIDTPDPESIVIEFFANTESDPSGHGEGEEYLGTVSPNSTGEFEVKLPKVKSGTFISATATDAEGNTSEFSENIEALRPGELPKELAESENKSLKTPEEFDLSQNFPNPFNPTTKITYCIPEDENIIVTLVNLSIYDALGREVAVLVNDQKSPGYYEVSWDASTLPSGVYFYKLTAGSFVQFKKMILLR